MLWWQLSAGQLCGFATSKSIEKEFVVDIQFPVRDYGKRTLVVAALCDGYYGIDRSVTIPFTGERKGVVEIFVVLKEGQVPIRTFVHPDDLKLDDQPTLFQSMVGTVGGDVDEDFRSHSDDESTY